MFENAKKLRMLLSENADLPIVVLKKIGDETTESFELETGSEEEYVLGEMKYYKGMVLDCPKGNLFFKDKIYVNKEYLRQDVVESLYGEIDWEERLSDEEIAAKFNELVDKKMEQYEPFWKDCIIVRVVYKPM